LAAALVQLADAEFGTPVLEAPQFEAPQFEAPPFEAPPFEAPPFEAPPFEAPKFEAPKFEAPKIEGLRAASPQGEAAWFGGLDWIFVSEHRQMPGLV
jgi:hypothetical protein